MKVKASDFLRDVFVCAKAILEKEHKALRCCGLSLSDYFILSSIDETLNRKMTDIAKELFISRAAATYAVDRLVRRGLIRRSHPKECDRRVVLLEVTPKARRLLRSVQCKQKALLRNSFRELPEHIQKQVLVFSPRIKSFFRPDKNEKHLYF